MTFIREWTDPEDSMHSGLGKLTPSFCGATEPGDRSQRRECSASGTQIVAMPPKTKKAAINPGADRVMPPSESRFIRTLSAVLRA
jgi:hypothetical protein